MAIGVWSGTGWLSAFAADPAIKGGFVIDFPFIFCLLVVCVCVCICMTILLCWLVFNVCSVCVFVCACERTDFYETYQKNTKQKKPK